MYDCLLSDEQLDLRREVQELVRWDASRALVSATARAVDAGVELPRQRRLISETKRFVTRSCQRAAEMAMQTMGGIAYTNIYPVERIVRDLRLASIWTGTDEVMSLIAASEWYREQLGDPAPAPLREHEADAAEAGADDEKVF